MQQMRALLRTLEVVTYALQQNCTRKVQGLLRPFFLMQLGVLFQRRLFLRKVSRASRIAQRYMDNVTYWCKPHGM